MWRRFARDAELRRAEAIAAIRSAADVLGPLAGRCGADLARFLDQLAMGAEVDTWDPRADRISLLTLHAAKGLEFPVVFIVGCDDGLLPLRPWRGAEIDYAEERRLLFVGMTRATTRLTLLTAAKRMVRGEVTECSPSPFLASVDRALLDRRDGGAVRPARPPPRPGPADRTVLTSHLRTTPRKGAKDRATFVHDFRDERRAIIRPSVAGHGCGSHGAKDRDCHIHAGAALRAQSRRRPRRAYFSWVRL